MLGIHNLKKPKGASKKKKRVGCGPGSGHGKTSTRGHKGQGQHAGSKTYIGFEGGKIPFFRHIPKRGFAPPFRKIYQVVNLKDIQERFEEGEEVTPITLRLKGLIRDEKKPVKILGEGNLKKPLVFKVDKLSKKAKEVIERVGGKILC